MIICTKFKFDSAHKLLNYKGKCAKLHGHTYLLYICIQGDVAENGMVFDFVEMKHIVDTKIISQLDHQYLNEIIKQPTAENISIWIWNQLKGVLPLSELKLWETPDNYVIYNGNR